MNDECTPARTYRLVIPREVYQGGGVDAVEICAPDGQVLQTVPLHPALLITVDPMTAEKEAALFKAVEEWHRSPHSIQVHKESLEEAVARTIRSCTVQADARSFLVITMPDDIRDDDWSELLGQLGSIFTRLQLPKDFPAIPILALRAGMTIVQVPEEQMNDAGWYRKETYAMVEEHVG